MAVAAAAVVADLMVSVPAVTVTLLSLAPLESRRDADKYARKAVACSTDGGAAEPEYSDVVERGDPYMGTAP